MISTVATARQGNWNIEVLEVNDLPTGRVLLLVIDHPLFDLQAHIANQHALQSILALVLEGEQPGIDLTDKSRSFAKFHTADLFVFVTEERLWFLLLDRTLPMLRFRVTVQKSEIDSFVRCMQQVIRRSSV